MIESEIVKISKNVVLKVSFFCVSNYGYCGFYFFVIVFICMMEWIGSEGGWFVFDAG